MTTMTGSEHHERMAEVRAELKARVAVPLPAVVGEGERESA